MWEREDRGVLRHQCHVGHAWNEQSLEARQAEEVEEALWTAVRTMREKAALSDRLARRARDRGHTDVATKQERNAKELRESADTVADTVRSQRLAITEEPQL